MSQRGLNDCELPEVEKWSSARDHIESLSRDALLTILHANGGFTAGGEEDVRDIVRMVRTFYAEIESPTTRKAARRQVREDDEEDL